MPAPSRLQALVNADPAAARAEILETLFRHDGHRARAAADLCPNAVHAYQVLRAVIRKLPGLDEEIAQRWSGAELGRRREHARNLAHLREKQAVQKKRTSSC